MGVPSCGKTTLAIAKANLIHAQTGKPVCIIDTAEVAQVAGIPKLTTDTEVTRSLWENPRGHCRIVPQTTDELEHWCKVLRKGKDVVLLLDESHVWLDAHGSRVPSLLRLMRSTQHCRVDVVATTHHLTGDVSQLALTCATEIYVFRCVSPRTLDVLESEFRLPREAISSLGQGEFATVRLGF